MHVAVAVVGLGVLRELHLGIGADEAAELRVVEPPVHVDETDVVELLVADEAIVGLHRRNHDAAHDLPVRVPAPAEGIEAQSLDHVAGFVGDHVHGTQVVAVQIAGLFAAVAGLGIDGDGLTTREDVVPVFADAVFAGLFESHVGVHPWPEIQGRGAAAGHFDPVVIRVVLEADRGRTLGDLRGLVEGGPDDGASIAVFHVTVGIVMVHRLGNAPVRHFRDRVRTGAVFGVDVIVTVVGFLLDVPPGVIGIAAAKRGR